MNDGLARASRYYWTSNGVRAIDRDVRKIFSRKFSSRKSGQRPNASQVVHLPQIRFFEL